MITATWDQTTVVSTVISESISGASVGVISFNVSGTLTAGQINFEVSDDGNHWYAIPGIVQSTFALFTSWQPTFGTSFSLQYNLAGFQFWRLRLNTALTGTGNVTMIATSFPSTPFLALVAAVQQNGANLHMALDDGAGGTPANVTAKGTQGVNALAVQDLHDAGRAGKVFTASFTSTAAAETPINFQVSTDGGALTAAAASYTVTAGKKLRIMGMTAQMRAGGTTPAASLATLKVKIGGNLQGMPYQTASPTSTTVTPSIFPGIIVLADGWELLAGSVISFTLTLSAFTATTNTPVIDVGLIGYEY